MRFPDDALRFCFWGMGGLVSPPAIGSCELLCVYSAALIGIDGAANPLITPLQ